jgi:pSer/pThr/pTyr-binding forkhead associated (FHA) protein
MYWTNLRMADDPRLCSVHLQLPIRREDYRRAREALLGACGQPTLAVDRQQLDAIQARATQPPGTQTEASKYWLVDTELVHSLKVGLNTIGRMPDNDVSILDSSVSRRHAAILIHVNESCELHDTASKNGTFLNGARITGATPIKTGDQVRLCDRTLKFVVDAEAPMPRSDDANSITIVDGA